jgi:hypothetical protein
MSTVSLNSPRFDEVSADPDGSLTAYSYFSPNEPVLRELVANLALPGAEA